MLALLRRPAKEKPPKSSAASSSTSSSSSSTNPSSSSIPVHPPPPSPTSSLNFVSPSAPSFSLVHQDASAAAAVGPSPVALAEEIVNLRNEIAMERQERAGADKKKVENRGDSFNQSNIQVQSSESHSILMHDITSQSHPLFRLLHQRHQQQINTKSTPSTSTSTSDCELNHKQLLTDQFVYQTEFPSIKFVRHLVVPTDDLTDLAVKYGTRIDTIRRYNRRIVFDYLDNVMNEFILIPVDKHFVMKDRPRLEEEGPGRDQLIVPGTGGKTVEQLKIEAETFRKQRAIHSLRLRIRQSLQQQQKPKQSEEETKTNTPSSSASPSPSPSNGGGPGVITDQELEFYLLEANWNTEAALSSYLDDLKWERDQLLTPQERQLRDALQLASSSSSSSSSSRYANVALAIAQARQNRLASTSLQTNQKEAEKRAEREKAEKRRAKKNSLIGERLRRMGETVTVVERNGVNVEYKSLNEDLDELEGEVLGDVEMKDVEKKKILTEKEVNKLARRGEGGALTAVGASFL